MRAMFLGESTTKECACSSAKVKSQAHQFSSLDTALVIDGAKLHNQMMINLSCLAKGEFALEE
jgi:hypothetical protein